MTIERRGEPERNEAGSGFQAPYEREMVGDQLEAWMLLAK